MARTPRRTRQVTGKEPDYMPVPARTEEEVLNMNGIIPSMGGDEPPREPPPSTPREEEPAPRRREPPAERSSEEPREEPDDREEVLIGSRSVRVDRETAALLREQEASHQMSIAAARRQEPSPAKPEAPEEDPFRDIDKEIFVDPRGVVNKIVDTVTTKLNKDLIQRYTNDQRRQQYMQRFYQDNKDLVGMEDTVENVLNQHLQELSAMQPDSGRRRLSDLVRGHINQIVRRYGNAPSSETEEVQPRRTVVEGADRGERRQAPREEQPAERPSGSISSLLQERRRARQRTRATR